MSQPEPSLLAEQLYSAFEEGDPEVAHKKREQENIRALQHLYAAFLRGDVQTLLDGLAEDVDWSIAGPAALPFAGIRRGRAEVLEALKAGSATLAEQQPEIRDVVAQGDMVVVVGHERGRHRATQKPYEGFWVHVFTFRDGKVARFREYLDPLGLMEAMRPEPANPAHPSSRQLEADQSRQGTAFP